MHTANDQAAAAAPRPTTHPPAALAGTASTTPPPPPPPPPISDKIGDRHLQATVPQYETGAARSSRMIIDAASYMTTPCDSPPHELRHVFSAQDHHRPVPDVATLAAVDQALRRMQHRDGVPTVATTDAARADVGELGYRVVEETVVAVVVEAPEEVPAGERRGEGPARNAE